MLKLKSKTNGDLMDVATPRPARNKAAIVKPAAKRDVKKAASVESRGSDDTLKSLGKIVRILECFSTTDRTLSVAEVCERTEYPRSTTHRLLASLKEVGLLDQDRHRDRYRLGMKLFELGNIVLANMDLHREARPYVEQLGKLTGQLVHLAVFDGRQAIVIHRSDPSDSATPLTFVEIGPGALHGCGQGDPRLPAGRCGRQADRCGPTRLYRRDDHVRFGVARRAFAHQQALLFASTRASISRACAASARRSATSTGACSPRSASADRPGRSRRTRPRRCRRSSRTRPSRFPTSFDMSRIVGFKPV